MPVYYLAFQQCLISQVDPLGGERASARVLVRHRSQAGGAHGKVRGEEVKVGVRSRVTRLA